MIPRHAPPFGIGHVLRTVCRPGSADQRDLEGYCAEHFQVREAIVLPSARAAILLALQASGPAIEAVVGPAFTCGVVHQAIRLSGLPVRLVDVEEDGYLMDQEALRKATDGRNALILSEIYGLRYRMDALDAAEGGRCAARIWDMAMCVPLPEDLARMRERDATVMSFGLGKCLYAGWGGLLLTQSTALATCVRELATRLVSSETARSRLRQALDIGARTAAHQRTLYGLSRCLLEWRRQRSRHPVDPERTETPDDPPSESLPREWTEPMTTLPRKLTRWNLEHAAENDRLRCRQATRYLACLGPSGVVRGLTGESLPQSHFPIRVAAGARDSLREYLKRHGVDTATYFPFSRNLPRSQFPHAASASDEVILLPMGRPVGEAEVETVARHVAIGLKEMGRSR